MKMKRTWGLYTRAEIADYLGISRTTLHKLERLHPFFDFKITRHVWGMDKTKASNWIRALISEGRILRARISAEALREGVE